MPLSHATRASADAPSRFDLYGLETTISRALNELNVDALGDTVAQLSKNVDAANDKVGDLIECVGKLRASIDALAKIVEKLPEQLLPMSEHQ